MKTGTVNIEVEDGRVWMYQQRSCGEFPNAPLHTVLRWVIEQLNLGCVGGSIDDAGDVVTLTLGKQSALRLEALNGENATEEAKARCMAVNVADMTALAREEGAEPKVAGLVDEVSWNSTDNPQAGAWMNTELAYAFRFVDLLARVREKTFELSCPPIKRVLPPRVSGLLREATRAYLYQLNGACVSTCRALLECALKYHISRDEVRAAMATLRGDKPGELEALVAIAKRRKILTGNGVAQAERIRELGNKVLHKGHEPSDSETWRCVLDVRFILEELCDSTSNSDAG